MSRDQEESGDAPHPFADWMETAAAFWSEMLGLQAKTSADTAKSMADGMAQAEQVWRTGNALASFLLSTAGSPDGLGAFQKGMDVLPDFLLKMTSQMWDTLLEAQTHWMDHAANLGRKTAGTAGEDPVMKLFSTWRKAYDEEFQKMFQIPQLGLTRFYQERFNRFIDQYNQLQRALGEFVYTFYKPIEDSLSAMQEKLRVLAEEGSLKEDPREYYTQWIRTLEGQYMTLLQSREYTGVLEQTLETLVRYKTARDEFLYDLLQTLPVPTNREMDQVYQELYHLKKKVADMSRRLEEIPSAGREGEPHEPDTHRR